MLLALGFYYVAAKRAFYDRVRSIKAQRVDAEVERLRKQDHLNLPNLFALNRRQLDEYHIVSVRQQAVALRNAQIASAIWIHRIADRRNHHDEPGGRRRALGNSWSGRPGGGAALRATLRGDALGVFC